MAIFKDHNITVKHLLGFIPEALMANLSLITEALIGTAGLINKCGFTEAVMWFHIEN